jgi:hypothetical protein
MGGSLPVGLLVVTMAAAIFFGSIAVVLSWAL